MTCLLVMTHGIELCGHDLLRLVMTRARLWACSNGLISYNGHSVGLCDHDLTVCWS